MSYNDYTYWGLVFIFLILLGIFIIFVIIVASGQDYYRTAKQQYCRAYLSDLSGQLLRANAQNSSEQEYYKGVYNRYVTAAGCSTDYKL